MTTGNLTSLFSYVISMLMSLMMLSMIFVMVAMSMASFRRIMEVLRERPDLVNPPQALTQIADGSIDFDHVYLPTSPAARAMPFRTSTCTSRPGRPSASSGARAAASPAW